MQSTVAQAIERATLDVFAVMVGDDLAPVTLRNADWLEHRSIIVSSLELSGPISGTAQVFYSLPLARRITCQMLQVQPPASEIDILDAAGEIANMIVGNVRNSLKDLWGSIGIGAPTVEISSVWAPTKQAMNVSFLSYGDMFTVSVAFQKHADHCED